MAAGEDEVPVRIDVDRVAVDVVHRLRGEVMRNDVRDLEVVPAAPLEHHILVAIQLLNDEADDPRVDPASRHDLAQVHDLAVVAHQDGVTVRKESQVVRVGRIAVSAGETVDHVVAGIQGVEAPGGRVEIGKPAVRLHLEIERRPPDLTMEERGAVVLQNHDVRGDGNAQAEVGDKQSPRRRLAVHRGPDNGEIRRQRIGRQGRA